MSWFFSACLFLFTSIDSPRLPPHVLLGTLCPMEAEFCGPHHWGCFVLISGWVQSMEGTDKIRGPRAGRERTGPYSSVAAVEWSPLVSNGCVVQSALLGRGPCFPHTLASLSPPLTLHINHIRRANNFPLFPAPGCFLFLVGFVPLTLATSCMLSLHQTLFGKTHRPSYQFLSGALPEAFHFFPSSLYYYVHGFCPVMAYIIIYSKHFFK